MRHLDNYAITERVVRIYIAGYDFAPAMNHAKLRLSSGTRPCRYKMVQASVGPHSRPH